MIILGIVLLVAGFLLKISILWTFGILLLVVGAILAILGSTGRAIGGRRRYFWTARDSPTQPPDVVPQITKSRFRRSQSGYSTPVRKGACDAHLGMDLDRGRRHSGGRRGDCRNKHGQLSHKNEAAQTALRR